MRAMKDSGIAWIGEIPADWSITILSALFYERKYKNRGLVEKNLLSLSYGNIVRKSIESNEGLLPASFETYNIVESGNIVFRLTDLQNDKRSLRTGLCKERGIITSAYVTLQIRSDDSPRYMHYLFHTYDLCKVFYGLGDGVRQGMNYEDLKHLQVLRPDLKTQHRIADYLDRKCSQIDAIIARQQEVIEKLKAYKLSRINEIVVEVEGITAHLGYVSNMKNGLNFNVVPDGKTLKFLGVGDFKDHYVLDSEEMFSDILIDDKIDSDYMLQSGDIIFVRSNGSKELVGRAVMVENVTFPLSYSGFCIRFRNLKTDILKSKYLLYFFRSPYFRKQLEKYSQGSNITNINQVLLSQISIIIPPIKVQDEAIRRVEKLLEAINKLIKGKQEIVSALERYKKSLIYEVVTGKKEV